MAVTYPQITPDDPHVYQKENGRIMPCTMEGAHPPWSLGLRTRSRFLARHRAGVKLMSYGFVTKKNARGETPAAVMRGPIVSNTLMQVRAARLFLPIRSTLRCLTPYVVLLLQMWLLRAAAWANGVGRAGLPCD